MISERLKELDIKITELASYLNISRPTLYRFIELYDLNKTDELKKDIKDFFDFIENNELIGKINVIDYIFSHFTIGIPNNINDENIKKRLIKILSSEEIPKNKLKIIEMLLKNTSYDNFVDYLIIIQKTQNKKTPYTEEEKNILNDYKKIINLINKKLKGVKRCKD